MQNNTVSKQSAHERLMAAGFDSETATRFATGYSKADAAKLLRRVAVCTQRGWWADRHTFRPCASSDPGAVPDVGRAIFMETNGYDIHEEVATPSFDASQ